MNNQIQQILIDTIREKVPQEHNLAVYLADKLNLGRESVYRRLRGEIYFTFDEIALLSQEFGFSIDNIVGAKSGQNALFNIHMLQEGAEYLDIYMNKMKEYGRMFSEMSEHSDLKARISINTLPYYLHIGHDNLSRFRIYKWLHQNLKIGTNDKFADFELPEEILQTHKSFNQDIQKLPDITIIMDGNIFWSAAKDIAYFQKRGLLSEEDVQILKNELLEIIDTIEEDATKGSSKSGARTSIYISSVDLEASYLHFENDERQFSQVRVFSISAIDSSNEGLCRIQKEWIESLKKYSVLISKSGEMQRYEYMNRQREIINNIACLETVA